MQAIRRLLGGKLPIVAAILYSILLTFLLLFPGADVPKVDIPYLDKIGHLLAFAILTLLWLFATLEGMIPRNTYLVLLSILIYGIVIEVLQEMFFANRTGDYLDLLANSIGMIVGWIIYRSVRKVIISKN